MQALLQYLRMLRQLTGTFARRQISRGAKRIESSGQDYLAWYWHSQTWRNISWLGVPTRKLPTDMWNYQEILTELRPQLIIEFGSFAGGSALFFSSVLSRFGRPYKIFSVDITDEYLCDIAKNDPNIMFYRCSTSDPRVASYITELRSQFPGPVFAILDSNHQKAHVLAEMTLLRPVMRTGDYLVVEDSHMNGHPNYSREPLGPGPFEALTEYMQQYPEDYRIDYARESKFAGVTFAPHGYLIRK